jgi:hypothetical protein
MIRNKRSRPVRPQLGEQDVPFAGTAYVTMDKLDAGRCWNGRPPQPNMGVIDNPSAGTAYVTVDSLDAGQCWNGRPPSLSDYVKTGEEMQANALYGTAYVAFDSMDEGVCWDEGAGSQQVSTVHGMGEVQRDERMLDANATGSVYVVDDSMDDGLCWNGLPTPSDLGQCFMGLPKQNYLNAVRRYGLGQRLACLPPNSDAGLGQFTIFQGVATIAGAAITAAGQVGSAFIAADASKYAVRQQTKADLGVALARAQADLKIAQVQAQETTDVTTVTQQETTKRAQITAQTETQVAATQVQQTQSFAPVAAILGIGVIAALIMLKD